MASSKPEITNPVVTIDPDIAEALDKLATIKGYTSRDILARRILREYVNPAIEVVYHTLQKRTVYENETPYGKDDRHLLRVQLVEYGMPSSVRKDLLVQSVEVGWEGKRSVKTAFRFSMAQIAQPRTVLLPWLEKTFAEAEAAHREEVKQKLRAGQQERLARTPEQAEAEATIRKRYTEQYGKELWAYATSQVSRHRARARRRNLTEHFTAEQWLLLAERQGFCCAECKKPHADEHLQSHHIRALMHEGKNTIGNIILLCATCHLTVEGRGEECGDQWLAFEQQKAALFAPGTKVVWHQPVGVRYTERGEVLEVMPPTRGDGPLWCQRQHKRNMYDENRLCYLTDGDWRLSPPFALLIAESEGHEGYLPAFLKVRWIRNKKAARVVTVRPDQVCLVQTDADMKP